jgi:inhibitor of KinA sporulation pathway (predicted exonuclease)
MDKTLLLALDLEMNQPSGAIIQVGAVLGDVTTGLIVDRLRAHVNAGEVLAPHIVKLTGIRQADVDAAGDLDAVFLEMLDWMQPHEHRRFMNPLTWGGGDAEQLRSQLGSPPSSWPFGRRWIDAKTLFVSMRIARGQTPQGGLSRAMREFGLAFQGRKHDACDDAFNTFRIYMAMLEMLKEPEPRSFQGA